MIGCNNGTIQIWKDSSKIPEFIIESGYSNIDKLFYDEINNYIFINNNKNLKIIEIDLEKILINVNEEEKNSKNMIAETLKDEDDKVAENNMILLSKAFQTPKSSSNKNEKNINDKSGEEVENKKEINNKENRDTEDESNIDENEYNYEVRNIDGLDGWNEW